jgi:hypothetical protein
MAHRGGKLPLVLGEGGPVVRSVDFLYSLYDALVSINVPNDKARAVVDAMERDMATHLATKSDLSSHRLATQSDLALLRQEVQSGLASVRQEMKSEFAAVRQEMAAESVAIRHKMTSEFAAVRRDMAAEFASVRHEMAALRLSMTIRLGSMQIVGLSLLFAALKLT